MPPTTRSARRAALSSSSSSQPRRDEPAAARAVLLLDALPADLLTLVLLSLSTRDLGRVDQLCHAFHSTTGDAGAAASVVEEALRRRAVAAGGYVPTEMGGEASMSQFLMWLERRLAWPGANLVDFADDLDGRTRDKSKKTMVCVDLHGAVRTCRPLGAAKVVRATREVAALRGVRVVSVATGGAHSLALTEKGEVYSWGESSYGRLGHGQIGGGLNCEPYLIRALRAERIVRVTAGKQHNLALTDDGRVFYWGCDYPQPQIGRLRHSPTLQDVQGVKIVDISAGHDFSLAVSEAGLVYSWGMEGDPTRLGHPLVVYPQAWHEPRSIAALHGVKIVAVSCGSQHSLALTDTGRVYSWGEGLLGSLGHCDTDHQQVPKLIEALHHVRVERVAAYEHAYAFTKEGAIYSWGMDAWWAPYITIDWFYAATPRRLSPPETTATRFVDAAAGDAQRWVVTDAGDVRTWIVTSCF